MTLTTRHSVPLIVLLILGLGHAILAAGCARNRRSAVTFQADPFEISDLLSRAVSNGAFPGCAVAVGTDEGPLWLAAYGHLDYTEKEAAGIDTLYDLASLTKVCSTTLVALRLMDQGLIALDNSVSRYLPEFRGEGREKVTIEHLLTHTSGLPAWRNLYEAASSYETLVELAAGTQLELEPGLRTRYSDIGIILLGEVLARAAGKPLIELEQELVFRPLGMKDTLRQLPESRHREAAPTERQAAGHALRGVVHDENARAGEGLTGHAGLFSTARDLARLAEELLRAWHGHSDLFPGPLLKKFTTRRSLSPESSRALGWDTPSGKSSSGRYFGPRSFGHTGFTGTSLWIDPDRPLYILLLTNRVHPTRDNKKIARVRRELADRVVESVVDGKFWIHNKALKPMP